MPEYKHEIIEFYGDKIRFFINGERSLVGMRSIVESIGLSWSTQLQKLKQNQHSVFINTVCLGHYKILGIIPEGIYHFLESIDMNRVKNKDRVLFYKAEFPRFVFDSIGCSKLIEVEDNYLNSKEGIKSLIIDSIITLGNPNAIDQLSCVVNSVVNKDIFPEKIPFFEKEHCPKTRKAFADLMQELRLKYSTISDPIYDMAEKTADRQAEIKRYKSESMQSQIEQIAENIRDIDRKSSLSLKRIAKGIK